MVLRRSAWTRALRMSGWRSCSFWLLALALLSIGCDQSDNHSPTDDSPASTEERAEGDASSLSPTVPAAESSPRANASAEAAQASEQPETQQARPQSAEKELSEASAQDTQPAAKKPLFQGWSKPKLVFVFTGRQQGYIEPCGCTGLANQKGGLARRNTFLHQLMEERGWTVVPLDVGDQIRRYGRQSEIKFQYTLEGLKKMQYRAVGYGPADLNLSIEELAAQTAEISGQDTPFAAANVAVLERGLTPRFKVIEAAGMRIGITSVLGDRQRTKLNVDEVLTEPAEDALKATWELLAAEKCDYHILLAHATREESIQLAQAVPYFDLVATAGGSNVPSFKPDPIPSTKSLLIEVGEKAMYAAVLGLFDDPTEHWKYEAVPLDSRFADSQDMLDLMASYQKALEQMGLEKLGVRPLKHPSGRKFVGSEKCGECHTKAFAVWQKTPHEHATQSLVEPAERAEIPRHYDPECLSCHVTGWNPQRYIPYDSGYLSLEATPLMTGNGCENCHGPGSAHVAAELGESNADDAALKTLRDEMKLPLAKAEDRCFECHDHDNSPDFVFEKYWKEVEHRGKD